MIHLHYFEIDLFQSFFKHANDGKDTIQRNEEKVMIVIEFPECTLQNYVESLTELAVHYKRDVLIVLQKRVRFASPEKSFGFCPAHDSSAHII